MLRLLLRIQRRRQEVGLVGVWVVPDGVNHFSKLRYGCVDQKFTPYADDSEITYARGGKLVIQFAQQDRPNWNDHYNFTFDVTCGKECSNTMGTLLSVISAVAAGLSVFAKPVDAVKFFRSVSAGSGLGAAFGGCNYVGLYCLEQSCPHRNSAANVCLSIICL
jgi:hypothetical protein